MRTIDRASSFKRDYKREAKGQHRSTLDNELKPVLVALVTDLLLIYRKSEPGTLRLARLGSHSELFG